MAPLSGLKSPLQDQLCLHLCLFVYKPPAYAWFVLWQCQAKQKERSLHLAAFCAWPAHGTVCSNALFIMHLGDLQVWPLLDIVGFIAFPILLGLTYIGPGAYFAVRTSIMVRRWLWGRCHVWHLKCRWSLLDIWIDDILG